VGVVKGDKGQLAFRNGGWILFVLLSSVASEGNQSVILFNRQRAQQRHVPELLRPQRPKSEQTTSPARSSWSPFVNQVLDPELGLPRRIEDSPGGFHMSDGVLNRHAGGSLRGDEMGGLLAMERDGKTLPLLRPVQQFREFRLRF
jgi:hypothetical protein